jgi:hypothetical protein
MNIQQSYEILQVQPSVKNEVVIASYKKLAFKYHPDKNRDRVEWATAAMTRLNIAYSTIMGYRFKSDSLPPEPGPEKEEPKRPRPAQERTRQARARENEKVNEALEELRDELAITRFIKIRETAKEALYRFFQYNLFTFTVREQIHSTGIFNEIVFILRKCYHAAGALSRKTTDPEMHEHFNVFREMLFDFYRAAECVSLFDTAENVYDINAYRSYKKADDILHAAHREIFFDRHNRGSFKSAAAYAAILKAEQYFDNALHAFPKSTWSVETHIKLEYTRSLKRYIELFFTDN